MPSPIDARSARRPRDPGRHAGPRVTDSRADLDAVPPTPVVAAPPRFVDRRMARRRVEDRVAHREKLLLARALDVLAADRSAEERLAGLLRLLARTVGARRAAVVTDGPDRRIAVSVEYGEDAQPARELAAWLDAHGPRSRVRRAAAPPASVTLVAGAADDPPSAAARRPLPRRTFAAIAIPSAGDVALGFEFARPIDAAALEDRLPRTLARHAAVALALVTSQLANERELTALRARDAERSTFISTVAHELRTPLTGLRGYLELILAGRVADRAVEREFLDRSRSIVGSMADLVGDLLELSRLESGTVNLEIGPFSVADAGSQVAAGLLPIAIDRGIRLTTSLPPRLRAATGDRRRVEQILTNLVANALKFTPEGGHVEIRGEIRGLVAVFVVRDDGEGIPADERGRIFERFQRMAGHESIAGTGLGLPIARDLARKMGGDLDVASVPGGGSAFVLVLPGPTEAHPTVIQAALAESLEREELGLEERIVRRAMNGRSKADAAEAAFDLPGDDDRTAVGAARVASVDPDGDDDGLPDREGPAPLDRGDRRAGPTRLRALPSIGPGERTPA